VNFNGFRKKQNERTGLARGVPATGESPVPEARELPLRQLPGEPPREPQADIARAKKEQMSARFRAGID